MESLDCLLLGAVSMVTPLGDTLSLVNTSVDSGICRYKETDIHGTEDNPSRMATVPASLLRLAVDSKLLTCAFRARQMRVLRLATLALKNIHHSLPEEPIPLFLAGPETYIGDPVINGDLFRSLVGQVGVNLDIANSRFVNSGRAGALDIIETAFRYLSMSSRYFALVGAADSYYDEKVMKYLDDEYRLAKSDTIDGFVPGEGAAFLLVVSPDAPEALINRLNVRIHRPGFTFEKGHLLSNDAYSGESLASAINKSLCLSCDADRKFRNVGRVYSCANGEIHFFKELNVALIRLKKYLSEKYEIVRPSDYFGDMGAVFGLAAIALSSTNLNSGENNVVYCSSDSGMRASVCMSLA